MLDELATPSDVRRDHWATGRQAFDDGTRNALPVAREHDDVHPGHLFSQARLRYASQDTHPTRQFPTGRSFVHQCLHPVSFAAQLASDNREAHIGDLLDRVEQLDHTFLPHQPTDEQRVERAPPTTGRYIEPLVFDTIAQVDEP